MRAMSLLAAAALGALAGMPQVAAQAYPSRPIRIINPYLAGGGLDYLIRPIAQKLSESLKVSVIVENRAGANGMIGTELTAKAAPDGYTLVAGTTGALTMNAAIYPNLPYDPIRDFTPITNYAQSAFILSVHSSLPVQSVKEFIALAKSRPGQVTYGSFGIGSSPHFGGALFSLMSGVKLIHVPYKGSAGSSTALLSGEVMSSFDSMQSVMPHIRAKRLRALGLAALKRSSAAPDIPTISESGLAGFEVGSWYGLLAPAHTPREIVTKLHAAMLKALAMPDIQSRITSVGTEPLGTTPEEFSEQMRSEMVKWKKVAREANMGAE